MNVFFARALVAAYPCVAMAQIAVLQIKVLEGEGAVHPAGARIVRPLTVEVTDEAGQPVAGAAVSFQLPPNGPSGLFANGLRTDLILTDASGRASIHSVQLNRTGGQFRIRITAVKEQARAGVVSTQFIGENRNAEPARAAKAGPAAAVPAATAPQPAERTKAASGDITPTITPETTAKSGEITPTTGRVDTGGHRKWVVILAIVAASAGAAFAGVTRASSSKSAGSGTVSSSVVSIGTPTVTIGNP